MSELSIELATRVNNKSTIWELGGKPIEPCPFCKSDAIHIVESDLEYNISWCGCSNCGAEGPVSGSRLGAIQRWQKRA